MKYTDEAIRKRKKIFNNIKRIFSTLAYLLLVPLLVYNISLIIQSVMYPNKTPNFLGFKTYVIVSGSMVPELEIGDIVIVKTINPEELEENEIISFRKGQSVITHRIIEIMETDNGREFKTKGDSNNTEDTEIIRDTEIEGKVIQKIPLIGKFALMLKSKKVIIILVIAYYIYLIQNQSIQKKKYIRNMKREDYEAKKENK